MQSLKIENHIKGYSAPDVSLCALAAVVTVIADPALAGAPRAQAEAVAAARITAPLGRRAGHKCKWAVPRAAWTVHNIGLEMQYPLLVI